ncbi:hypothetical protein J6G99_04780 [bacterium]|nr:hypothetical protein [bacterium]
MNKRFLLLLLIPFISSFISIDTGIFYIISHFLGISVLVLMLILMVFNLKKCSKEEKLIPRDFFIISTLAIYQPLHFYVENISEISAFLGIILCLSIYLFFGLMFFVINKFLRNSNKSLLISIILTFISLNFFNNVFIVCAIGIILFYLISKIDVFNIRKGLIVFSAILFLMNFVTLVENLYKINSSKQKLSSSEDLSKFVKGKSDKNRDIYIIVLDAYSGTDVLKQKWGFDNSEFINFLKDEGFYVFDKMYSNYNSTYASIPSILNLDYYNFYKYKDSSSAVNDALLFKIAKYNNYITVFKKIISFKIKSPYIDYVSEEHEELDILTFIRFFFKQSIIKNLYNENFIQKQNSTYSFGERKIMNKKFVFTHLLMPHYPYLFNEYGEHQSEKLYEDIDNGYLPYLKYVNNETIKYIQTLKQNKKNLPVILILGDHGLRDEKVFNSNFSTFLAYYNPEQQYKHVKKSKTLLNFFINFSNYELNTNIVEKSDKILFIQIYDKNIEINAFNISKYLKTAKDVTKRFIK